MDVREQHNRNATGSHAMPAYRIAQGCKFFSQGQSKGVCIHTAGSGTRIFIDAARAF